MAARAKKGIAVVVSGPSGSGKTTIVQTLVKANRNYERSVSVTTRRARAGEVNGKDYVFTTKKSFLAARRKGDFLEWATVFDCYYGTLKEQVLSRTESGKAVFLAIDVVGAKKIREKIKNVSIFIMPPSVEVLEKRLRKRKSDKEREIKKRLKHAQQEMRSAEDYDYVIVNNKLAEAVQEVKRIVRKEMRSLVKPKKRLAATT